MAQARPGDKDKLLDEDSRASATKGPGGVSFKFNAQAPEFVPRSHSQMPVPDYYCSSVHLLGGNGVGSDWYYLGDQDPFNLTPGPSSVTPNCSKTFLTDDLRQKIVKQVEYQLSDMSLLANDALMKQTNRDHEGYVPISVIASSKKIKSLINGNHQLLAQALQYSSKLIVSEDGKKVKRKHLFTDTDKEYLQSRTVVVENLPEDHSHQNLEKLFSVVGSVKTIRVWHPHESNSSRPKGDYFIGNKLHALVEYGTTEIAEKAVEKLNDERNWRKGLRVRLLLRCSPKSVLKSRKSDFDGILEDCEGSPFESIEDSAQPHRIELVGDGNGEASPGASEKGTGRGLGRAKARGGRASNNGRGVLSPSPYSGSSASGHGDASAKQVPKGPRMPDGTRGFAIGRGKTMNSSTSEQ